MKIAINGKFIVKVLLGTFIGWIIGVGISWINVFGHSEQAPLICAIAGSIYTFGRLVKQQKN